jgi:hypothetical protein
MVRFKLNYVSVVVLCLCASTAWSDSLQLKNGSLINGKFMGGTENEISFQVGSSLQKYNLADIASIKFDSAQLTTDSQKLPDAPAPAAPKPAETRQNITIPAETRISIRTVDSIDSTTNQPGDRFLATLEEPLFVEGNMVIARGADVYGQLAESRESGTFTGRSQLRLELTGLVVNGQTLPIVTGDYQLTGKSRGASTARRTIGGAAFGSIIGALADGGQGAAIGASAGATAGAASETITNGDQVKIPSQTFLEFRLEQDLSIPTPRTPGVE